MPSTNTWFEIKLFTLTLSSGVVFIWEFSFWREAFTHLRVSPLNTLYGELTFSILLLRTIRKGSIKYCVGQRVQGGLKIKKIFIKCNKNALSSNLKIDRLADFILNTNSTVFNLFYLLFFFLDYQS